MHAYNLHNEKSYFIVSGCCCGPLVTDLIAGSNGIVLLITGLGNRFNDPVPLLLLKLRKRNKN